MNADRLNAFARAVIRVPVIQERIQKCLRERDRLAGSGPDYLTVRRRHCVERRASRYAVELTQTQAMIRATVNNIARTQLTRALRLL